jgi:ribosomal protein L44E
MINSDKPVVEDTEENRQLCRKYCPSCQNYKKHSLEKHQPLELFCARGQSSATSMKIIGCFCPACELFTKHHLRGGFFCVRR